MERHLNFLLDQLAHEANASGDHPALDLIEEAAELVDGGATEVMTGGVTPNLIERLENLIHSLDSAKERVSKFGHAAESAYNDIDNASGIAGEILTMIDGR